MESEVPLIKVNGKMIGELMHLGILRDEAKVKKQMRSNLQIIEKI